MAEAEKKEGNGFLPMIIMFFIMVIFLVVAAVASFGSQAGACNGPCPQGDTLAQAVDPVDPATAALISQLKSFNNPAKFLAANAAQLDALRAQIVNVKNNINAGKPGFTTFDKTKVGPLLDKMLTELDQIRLNLNKQDAVSKKKLADLVTQFTADTKTFSDLVPTGAIACSQGGKCLDVPSVVQGHNKWCGKTSVIMAMLYYTKGQITGNLSGNVETIGGRLTSSGTSNSAFVTPSNLNAVSGHSDWTVISKPSSADAMYAMIKKSIDAGDPLVMYTFGTFYHTKVGQPYGHIVDVVGYNDSNQSIYVNNPVVIQGGGTKKGSNVGVGGQVLTKSFVYSTLGQATYGHSFIVRKAYL